MAANMLAMPNMLHNYLAAKCSGFMVVQALHRHIESAYASNEVKSKSDLIDSADSQWSHWKCMRFAGKVHTKKPKTSL